MHLMADVRCLQKATGAQAGFVHIPVLSPDQPANFGGVGAASSRQNVEMFRIDDLDLTACRLPRIDVEGPEPAALKGCVDTIRKNRFFLFTECNECSHADAIIGAIEVFDYHLWCRIGGYSHRSIIWAIWSMPSSATIRRPICSARPGNQSGRSAAWCPAWALATIGAPPSAPSRQSQHSTGLKAAASRGTSK